jgi:hypothetical protein
MDSLFGSIDLATEAMQSITPSSLSQDKLDRVQSLLESIDIADLLDDYAKELPEKPKEEDGLEGYLIIARQKADQLNKKIAPFLQTLEGIKKMRNALKLPALDVVINAGQNIIRPIYNFSASIQE